VSLVGANITCSTSFRGVQQEFGYTFHYDTAGIVSSGSAEALIDALVALLKPMHATSINFVRAKCWTAGGTKAENQMLFQKNLSGTGTNSAAPSTFIDKERAFLVRLRAGVDTKGRPAYLRKWFHLDVGVLGGSGFTNGQVQNTEALNSTHRNQLVTWANQFKSINATAQTWEWKGPKGRSITGDTVAHPYYEHHQLGDMWR
jgi:hypothetical protein